MAKKINLTRRCFGTGVDCIYALERWTFGKLFGAEKKCQFVLYTLSRVYCSMKTRLAKEPFQVYTTHLIDFAQQVPRGKKHQKKIKFIWEELTSRDSQAYWLFQQRYRCVETTRVHLTRSDLQFGVGITNRVSTISRFGVRRGHMGNFSRITTLKNHGWEIFQVAPETACIALSDCFLDAWGIDM